MKISILLLAASANALAATPGAEILLWPDGAPGSEAHRTKKEVLTGPSKGQDNVRVSGIHNPSILVYLPPKQKATGAAMIIAPGGGHRFLSLDTEGINVAKHLNGIGVAAFEIKAGLRRYRHQSHYIFYTEQGDALLIEDLIHVRRNLRRDLFDT